MAMRNPSHLGFWKGLGPSLLILLLIDGSPPAEAAGKKPPAVPNGPTASPYTTPQPAREIVIEPVDTTSFNLPNGNTISIADSLQAMLNTVVASTATLSPSPDTGADPCGSYLAIHPTVTEFEMNIASAGVTFGYSPSPGGPVPIPVVSNIQGSVEVKIGAISMDFELKRYTGGQWAAPMASHADQTSVSQASATFELDFSAIKTGAGFVYNPAVESIFRGIMANGINQIATNSELNELPWQASVKDFIPSTATGPAYVIFDAGLESRLAPNQAFTIFSPTDSSASGTCNVYCALADVHTIDVDVGSSTAIVDQLRPAICGGGNIQAGDVVKIHQVSIQ